MNEATTVPEAVSAEGTESSGDGTGAPPRRRRRRSRGRGRGTGPGVTQASPGETAAAEEGGAETTPSEEPTSPEQPARPATRRRRSRGGRGHKPAGATAATAEQEVAEGEGLEPVVGEATGPDDEPSTEGAPALTPSAKRRRRRRGGRG